MYEVFANNKPIVISKNKEYLSEYHIIENEEKIRHLASAAIFENAILGIGILDRDTAEDWKKFQSFFTVKVRYRWESLQTTASDTFSCFCKIRGVLIILFRVFVK